MKSRDDLKQFADALLDSYEMRVNTVNSLMGQAYEALKCYQVEVQDMILRLRDNLAKAESLRKKDFDRMIEDVATRWRSHAADTEQIFHSFQDQEKKMVDRLRILLLSGSSNGLEEVHEIRTDLSKKQKEREIKILHALKLLQVEQEELRTSLMSLLSKGESIRMKDFRMMLKALKAQQKEREGGLIRMIEDLNRVREGIQSRWRTIACGADLFQGS